MSRSTRSIKPTTDISPTVSGTLHVPWLTVLPLAILMAYADGFWMMSLRGAVGPVVRTQGPFATWLQESTLAVPVFVFAVLGALTLALRWFGSARKPRILRATFLMVVAAGTLAGIAQVGANSAYDYLLQSDTLQMMMPARRGGTHQLLALQEQASFGLQAHSVIYGGLILLATNLILAGWVVALRGGRLQSAVIRQPATTAADPRRSRVVDLRLLAAAGFVGGATIHAAVVPEHLGEWPAAGIFFILQAAAELTVAALLLTVHQRAVLLAAAVVSAGPLALWLYSRTAGLPFGPETGVPEQVGLADMVACVLEVATLVLAVVLLRGGGWPRRAPFSAHVQALTLVAVIAVTTIGLSGLSLLDGVGGSEHQSTISSP